MLGAAHSTLAAAALLAMVAALHSGLGERFVVQPAIGADWGPGRESMFLKATLRFAWHLTSLAWVGMALLLLLDGSTAVRNVVSGVALISGAVAFVASRGRHLAWPIFLFVATFAQVGSRGLLPFPEAYRPVLGAMVGSLLALLAALHVFWALGGRWGMEASVPADRSGAPLFEPPRVASCLVALALFGFGAVVYRVAGGGAPVWFTGFVAAGAVVFALRGIGDFRYCGLFKQVRGTLFSRCDTELYVPLCFGLSWCLLVILI